MAETQNILVFTMGGTIDSEPYPKGQTPDRVTPLSNSIIPDAIKRIDPSVSCTVIPICQKDSKDVTPGDLKKLIYEIRKGQKAGAHKILVMHGTDTMPQHARYVRDQLGADVQMPIIFAGAMQPLMNGAPYNPDEPVTDGFRNLEYILGAQDGADKFSAGVHMAMYGKHFGIDHIDKNMNANPNKRFFETRYYDLAPTLAPHRLKTLFDALNVSIDITSTPKELFAYFRDKTTADPTEIKNIIDILGGRIDEIRTQGKAPKQKITFTVNQDFLSRLSLAESYANGRMIVHMMEIKNQYMSLHEQGENPCNLPSRVLKPLLDLMAGTAKEGYSDLGLLEPSWREGYRYIAPSPRGVTAMAGTPLKLGQQSKLFEYCSYGFLFDGNDGENLDMLYLSSGDANSFYYDKDPANQSIKTIYDVPNHTLLIRDGAANDKRILEAQRLEELGQFRLSTEKKDHLVQPALDLYWDLKQQNKIPPKTSELVFNARIGALRGIIVRDESGKSRADINAKNPEFYLRALYIREYITAHYPEYISTHYPVAGTVPVLEYDQENTRLSEIRFDEKEIRKNIKTFQQEMPDDPDLKCYRWALGHMLAREKARGHQVG